jgi:KaiC/GvpD/RAD55 family RecA-like ATPase
MQLPILKEVLPEGLTFGTSLLVEFEPDSLWYETALTLVAQALRIGMKADYHSFQHFPDEIREYFVKLNIDVGELEDEDVLRIVDSYTATTGLSTSERAKRSSDSFQAESIKLADWSISIAQLLKAGVKEIDRRRLHIDDNTTVLNRFNHEEAIVDYWRTRTLPFSRSLQLTYVHSLVMGAHSSSFYKQFEALADGIIDFKTQESENELEQLVRVRVLRGRPHDSRWHRLLLLDSGEVALSKH